MCIVLCLQWSRCFVPLTQTEPSWCLEISSAPLRVGRGPRVPSRPGGALRPAGSLPPSSSNVRSPIPLPAACWSPASPGPRPCWIQEGSLPPLPHCLHISKSRLLYHALPAQALSADPLPPSAPKPAALHHPRQGCWETYSSALPWLLPSSFMGNLQHHHLQEASLIHITPIF